MTDTLLRDFADWVQTKPAEEAYAPQDCHQCALHQFLTDGGYPVNIALFSSWIDTAGHWHEDIWPPEIALTICYNNTFGALAERLASHTTLAKAIKEAADNGGRILPRVTTSVDMATALRLEAMANQGRE